jgi:molybdopterin converting factor subunit 1
MRVVVKLFAVIRDSIGVSEIVLDLREGETVSDLRQRLVESHGDAASLLGKCAIAVNRVYAARDTLLHEGDEVAVIPPVSGG